MISKNYKKGSLFWINGQQREYKQRDDNERLKKEKKREREREKKGHKVKA